MKKIFLLGLVALTFNAFAQKKLSISTGVGIPELTNLGATYQFNQAQAGVCFGFWPWDPKLSSLSGDIYYHFGKVSRYSDLRPLFGRLGIIYLRDEDQYYVDKYVYLNTRIGVDINISYKMGISLDGGAVFEFSEEYKEGSMAIGWTYNFDYPVLPTLGIRFFYRI